ncbi:MAG TPA: hypothetical protein VMT27_09820 [Actinomycetes bacterium]|nr:hypothetical protein [Actinomycetes bacterium]
MTYPQPGQPGFSEAADIERQMDAPIPPDQHPCPSCGVWLVWNNKIHHWREDCDGYPQERDAP